MNQVSNSVGVVGKAKVVNGQLAAFANEAEKAVDSNRHLVHLEIFWMLETDKESLKNRKIKYPRAPVW